LEENKSSVEWGEGNVGAMVYAIEEELEVWDKDRFWFLG
jgi:hypothetical protein